MPEVYMGNPRHKQPWQPGARGTMCPSDVDGVALFAAATADPTKPGKRYNTDGRTAYCAHPDTKNPTDPEQTITWHGFPVSWREVPISVQRQWVAEGRLRKPKLKG